MAANSNANGAQTLLIDADDTLWENNIYFERAIARFISFLNHREYSPEQVREILNEVERENIVTHGYGLHSFAHALEPVSSACPPTRSHPKCTPGFRASRTPLQTIRSRFCPKFQQPSSISRAGTT